MMVFFEKRKAVAVMFDRVRSAGDIKLDCAGNEYCTCPATRMRHADFQRGCSGCLKTGCKRLRAIGLDHYGHPLELERRPECGAKAHDRVKCKAKVVPGKTKCRLHGGASTGPKTLAGKRRIASAQRRRWAEFRRSSA